MKTPTVVTGAPARTGLSALGKLTVVAVIGLPLLLSTDFFQHGVNVANLVFTGIGLVLAAIVTWIMVATRWRWSPLLGAVLYFLVLAGSIYILPYALSHPNETYLFAFNDRGESASQCGKRKPDRRASCLPGIGSFCAERRPGSQGLETAHC